MGYQESFITTVNQKDFDAFAVAIKALGADYFTEHGFYPAYIVTVKQAVSVGIKGCNDKEIKLRQHCAYIYFYGERHPQRNARNLFNTPDDKPAPFDLEIVFSEEVDCSKLFDTAKNEEGEIHDGIDNEWIAVRSFEHFPLSAYIRRHEKHDR